MATSEVKYGLLVPLVAKVDKVDAVAKFLLVGHNLVLAEPQTAHWFGVKFDASVPNTFAIFDTFADEDSRKAHLSGKVAEALLANAPDLLSSSPDIGSVRVLASKVKAAGVSGQKAGLGVGLRVLITAKPTEVETVRAFLKSALPLVEAEPATSVWYAIEYPETATFGIVDFFPDEEGRNAHLNGKVAEALSANADKLLATAPDIAKFEVLAAKI